MDLEKKFRYTSIREGYDGGFPPAQVLETPKDPHQHELEERLAGTFPSLLPL